MRSTRSTPETSADTRTRSDTKASTEKAAAPATTTDWPAQVGVSPRSPASAQAAVVSAQTSGPRRALVIRQIQRFHGNRYAKRVLEEMEETGPEPASEGPADSAVRKAADTPAPVPHTPSPPHSPTPPSAHKAASMHIEAHGAARVPAAKPAISKASPEKLAHEAPPALRLRHPPPVPVIEVPVPFIAVPNEAKAQAAAIPYDPERARIEAAWRTNQFETGAERKIAALHEEGARSKERIRSDALKQQAAALSAVGETEARIAAEVKLNRTKIAAQASGFQNLVRGQSALGWSTFLGVTAQQVQEVHRSAETQKSLAARHVKGGQDRARAFGVAEGARGRAAIATHAATAVARGETKAAGYPETERGDREKEAVRGVANTMAAQMAEPKESIYTNAVKQADDLANGFSGAADQAIETIAKQEELFATQLSAQAPAHQREFQSLAAAAGHAVASVEHDVVQRLGTVESAARSQLTALRAGLAAEFQAAITFSHELVDQHVLSMESVIRRMADRTVTPIRESASPDPDGVARALDGVEGMLDDAVSGFAFGLADVQAHSAQTFAAAVKGVAGKLAQIQAKTAADLAAAAHGAQEAMASAAARQASEQGALTQRWKESLTSARAEVDAKWKELVAGVGGEVEKGLAQGKSGITKGVNESIVENAKSLDELEDKMEEAADKARYKYDHPIRYKIKHALWSFVKGLLILAGLVVAAVLAIAAIIVGIISGAVWLIVVGVVALVAVVGFAIYGIVSNIVRRIRSADSIGEGVWGFFVGIADLTGVPNIIEGIIEKDIVNGKKLTLDEAADRLGAGSAALVTFIIPVVKGIKGMRGSPRVPVEVLPEVVPEPAGGVPVEPSPGTAVEPSGRAPAEPSTAPPIEPGAETPAAQEPKAPPTPESAGKSGEAPAEPAEPPKTESPKEVEPPEPAQKPAEPRETESPKEAQQPESPEQTPESKKPASKKAVKPKKAGSGKSKPGKQEKSAPEETKSSEEPQDKKAPHEAPPAKVPFPENEFPPDDPSWQKWPPDEPPKSGPDWNQPGGTRWRWNRYRWEKFQDGETVPEGMTPKKYYDQWIEPKSRGQSPGEKGSPEHVAATNKVRQENGLGRAENVGDRRPDAMGEAGQELKVGDEVIKPEGEGRVIYEADNFFKDGSQIESEGRAQVRDLREAAPDATIVVQDAKTGKVLIYEPGTQPPPPGRLSPGTPWKVPFPEPEPPMTPPDPAPPSKAPE